MDNLISWGVLAVALFFLVIAGIAAGVLYGSYIITVALMAARYAMVLQSFLIIVLIALVYGGTGFLLIKLGII
jgi:hypothetical protein